MHFQIICSLLLSATAFSAPLSLPLEKRQSAGVNETDLPTQLLLAQTDVERIALLAAGGINRSYSTLPTHLLELNLHPVLVVQSSRLVEQHFQL